MKKNTQIDDNIALNCDIQRHIAQKKKIIILPLCGRIGRGF